MFRVPCAKQSRATFLWPIPALVLAGYAATHFWVCDDAFISFRYANNLIHGHGLVFNPGERVEGYTNFLWVLETAILHALGVPIAVASVILSVLCTVGVLLLTASLARSTPTKAFAGLAVFAALLMLATNRNFAVWTTSGLETRQFTFLVLLSVWWIRGYDKRPVRLLWVSLTLAAAELTRPEATLIFGCVVFWYSVDAAHRRALRLKGLARLVLPFVLIVTVHYVWRRLYYGDWLPNTYYAKVVRPWLDEGIVYFCAAALDSGLYLTVPLAALGGAYRWARRKDSLFALTSLLIIPHALFFACVGGDHFEFRILDFYWPLLAVSAADGMALIALCARLVARRRRWPKRRMLSMIAWFGTLSIAIVYGSVLQVAQFVLERPHWGDTGFENHIETELTRSSFPPAFVLPFMGDIAAAYQKSMSSLLKHAIAVRWIEHRVFARQVQLLYGPYQREDRELLPPGMIIAHPWLGILSYSLREVTVIDKRGLTDRTVARHRSPSNARRNMAHDRVPPPGYIKERGVNVTVEAAANSLAEAMDRAPFAVRLAPDLWAPLRSDKPNWLRSKFQDGPLYEIRWDDHRASIIRGRKVRTVRSLLDCEDPARVGWILEGLACASGPASDGDDVYGHGGRAWLSSSTSRQGDHARGRAVSPVFEPQAGSALLFRIGGGASSRVGVRLVDRGGEPLVTWHGSNSEELGRVAYDLEPQVGQRVQVEVFDEDAGDWGHVLVDDVLVLGPEQAE